MRPSPDGILPGGPWRCQQVPRDLQGPRLMPCLGPCCPAPGRLPRGVRQAPSGPPAVSHPLGSVRLPLAVMLSLLEKLAKGPRPESHAPESV